MQNYYKKSKYARKTNKSSLLSSFFLLLTRIADSENYPTVKKVILDVMEYNYQHYKVNRMVEMYENYYQKKDEIIQTLESLPIDLPKELIG